MTISIYTDKKEQFASLLIPTDNTQDEYRITEIPEYLDSR